MIRPLTQFDLDNAISIARLKNKIAGTTPIDDSVFETIHGKYFEGDGMHLAFGYFEDNVLVSFVGMVIRENKKRGKFWCISFLYTSKFNHTFTFNNDEIKLLIKECFNIAETLGYYDYYYTIAERVEKVYERQWARNNHTQTGRYLLETLAIVPANTQPDVELYWLLMGQETKPDNMVIKKRVLRNDLRPSINTSL